MAAWGSGPGWRHEEGASGTSGGAPVPSAGQVGGGARSRRAAPPDAVPGVLRRAGEVLVPHDEEVRHPNRPRGRIRRNGAAAHPRHHRGRSGVGLVRDVRCLRTPSPAFRGMPGRSSWRSNTRSTIRSTQHMIWEGRAAALPAAPMPSRWAGRSYGRCGTFRRRRGGPQCSQGGRLEPPRLGRPSVQPARRRATSKRRGLLRRSSVHLTSDF